MRKLVWLFFLGFTHSFAQQLEIGLLRDYSASDLLVSYHQGSYNVYGDTTIMHTILPTESVQIKRKGDKLELIQGVTFLGLFDTIRIKETLPNHSFRIQILKPQKGKERKYKNNLIIAPDNKDGIKIINEVEMQNYLGGVIESEGGGGKHLEYYKVQAILSRTYVLSHLTKHKKEGFHLCDRVHCQAYHNMLIYTPKIDEAVQQTKGLIMIDENFKLASGFFFANCGGQTSEADFVWNESVSYCRSVLDTFCIHSKQAKWTKRIPKTEWENYMISVFGYPIHDTIVGPLLYYFTQNQRKAFYQIPQLGIPLRDIRVNFKLKSTWFDCHLEGEEMVFHGKGFGHGVGLCQEGAMGMANNGYTYKQILLFYFTNIGIINYYHWYFYNQKENKVGL